MLVLALGGHSAAQSTPAFADPEYLITHWQTEDGLPGNSATAMAQDNDGYLWFGTFNGLVRFDGVAFRVFNRTNTPELPHNGIFNLHLDRSGRLWVSTLAGLVVRDRGVWEQVRLGEDWSSQVIRSFAERPTGEMMLTTLPGRILEIRDGGCRELPQPTEGVMEFGYWGFADEAGRWWVVQAGLVAEWDGHRWRQRSALPPMPPDRLGATSARGGGIWVLARAELRKYRAGTAVSSLELAEETGGVWSVYEDTRGYIWVSSYDRGLCRIDPSGNIRRWRHDNGLEANAVRFVFEDREHNIWVGTSGGGLSRFTPRRFRAYGRSDGIQEPIVNALTPDSSGGVWAATYGSGLYRVGDGAVTRVPFTDRRQIVYLQSVLEDRSGRLWVGTFDDWLFRSDDRGSTWNRIDASRTAGGNSISLYEDSAGRLWTCGGGGLAVLGGETYRVFTPDDGLPRSGYHSIVEDTRGVIWVSNSDDVYRMQADRFERVTDENGSPLRGVFGFLARPDGSVWMGGPVLRRWKDGTLTSLETGMGPVDTEIYGFVEDDEGFCWMPSNRGILRAGAEDIEAALSGGVERIRHQVFDRADGLPTIDCTGLRQPICGRDASGMLWFATGKGVISVDPGALRLNEATPPVRFESVTYQTYSGETTEAPPAGPGGEPIRLPPGSRSVEIRYTALSLTSPGKVRFESRLAGVDRSWQQTGARRSVRYEALPPGRYSLQLRASNNDGLWTDEPAVLAFSITPFVWQTLWFKATAVSLLAACIGVVVWLLTRANALRMRERLELRQHRNELIHLARANTLGELSGALAHELSQPLTAILTNAQAAQRFLGQQPANTAEVGEILADIVREDRRAGEIIHRLRHLLKKGEVNTQPLELGDVLDDVLALVHSDLINRNITVLTDLPPGARRVLADRVQLQQVLLNLIGNAAEAMASAGSRPDDPPVVVVRGRAAKEGFVEITVEDSGPGFPDDRVAQVFEPFYTTKASGMGLGLCICRTIVTAHGGRIWAENNPDRGASVHILLPSYTDHPAPEVTP
ncbi:MAG: two-component regulator propeller domain-containing protein [Phycisphaerales bacterium JB040]